MEVISELDQKISTFEEWADEQGQIEEEKGIWSDFAYEGLMKDNVKFMAGSEDNAISDEDYATCEALAQDGESIEEYAI